MTNEIMDTEEATTTPYDDSQQIVPQFTVASSSLLSASSNRQQGYRAPGPDVLVTPSSSTSTRKRGFTSLDTQLNDPNFRTSCKRRFLHMSQNNNTSMAHTPLPRRIDLLRDVVRNEFLQHRGFKVSDQSRMNLDANGGHMHQLPLANHYVDDDELYDLLLEMEQELNDSTEQHTTTVMSDWEEEIYYATVQQHDEDGIQAQIMDYYNQE